METLRLSVFAIKKTTRSLCISAFAPLPMASSFAEASTFDKSPVDKSGDKVGTHCAVKKIRGALGLSYSLLLLVVLASGTLHAQIHYSLVADQNLTSLAASENLLTIHKALYTIENRYLKTTLFEEKRWLKKAMGITYRLAKTQLLDYPIDYMVYLLQHEAFGHGARFREYDYVNSKYKLNPPWPYGWGYGSASPGRTDRIQSVHENILFWSGGMEANTLLSRAVLRKWLLKGTINYRESLLYIKNYHNITSYVFGTARLIAMGFGAGGDVVAYLNLLHTANGISYYDHVMTAGDLKQLSIIQFLDPFQYLALYTYLRTYIWKGEEASGFLMIPIGPLQYLPSFHLGLSPFGPELHLEHYFKFEQQLLSLYYRWGDRTFHRFWGAGIRGFYLMKQPLFDLDAGIDIWRQPPVEIGGATIMRKQGGIGGALQTTLHLKMVSGPVPISLYVKLGYKTTGYQEGEMLTGGPILRLGISFEEKVAAVMK